jgi:hypothetical protein
MQSKEHRRDDDTSDDPENPYNSQLVYKKSFHDLQVMHDSKWCTWNSVQERGKNFGREQRSIHEHIADRSCSHKESLTPLPIWDKNAQKNLAKHCRTTAWLDSAQALVLTPATDHSRKRTTYRKKMFSRSFNGRGNRNNHCKIFHQGKR